MTATITTTTWNEQVLRDLLVTAFEGGINYWARLLRYQYPQGRTAADYRVTDQTDTSHPEWWPSYARVPLEGGAIVLVDAETGEEFPQPLDRAAVERGLNLLADQHPHRWADIRAGLYDVEDADAVVQLALFGELVFG